MSYILNIEIQRKDIINEVNKTCGYIGARNIPQDGKTLYNNVSSDKYTAEMLTRYWNEACANVIVAGKEFVRKATGVDAEALTLQYELSDTYNTALDESVRQLIFSYIVWYMLSLWLEMCGMTALAESYAKSAAAFVKQIDNYLYTRMVSRASTDESTDNDNQIGDEVSDIDGDGSGDGDEPEGDNQIGDEVESFGGDGSGDGDEPEGSNEIGGELPQQFGEVKVKEYWIGRDEA